MGSAQKLPWMLWRDVVEMFGKMTDLGKAEDAKSRDEWESRVGCDP